MHLFVLMWISQGARKPHLKALVKYGDLTKCFTNNHSATISYLSEGHTNVIVNHAKRALFFLKRALFLITLKVGGGHVPPVPPPPPFLRPCIQSEIKEYLLSSTKQYLSVGNYFYRNHQTSDSAWNRLCQAAVLDKLQCDCKIYLCSWHVVPYHAWLDTSVIPRVLDPEQKKTSYKCAWWLSTWTK